jgi:hypothetical protein
MKKAIGKKSFLAVVRRFQNVVAYLAFFLQL